MAGAKEDIANAFDYLVRLDLGWAVCLADYPVVRKRIAVSESTSRIVRRHFLESRLPGSVRFVFLIELERICRYSLKDL